MWFFTWETSICLSDEYNRQWSTFIRLTKEELFLKEIADYSSEKFVLVSVVIRPQWCGFAINGYKGGQIDRWERLHLPRCNITRKDRHIMVIALMDRTATLRNIAQETESVAKQYVWASTILRILRLFLYTGISGRHPLLRLHLNPDYSHLRL